MKRGSSVVNWLRPRRLKGDDRIWVRIVRLVYWFIVGVAVFGLVVDFAAMIVVGNREPVSYVAVALMWIALAMLGRGFRYVLVRE
jgi:hypothetical protein